MKEAGDLHGPEERRIPQSELRGFQSAVTGILGNGDKIGWREYPLVLDGEEKVAHLRATEKGKFTQIRIRDVEPTGPQGLYVHDDLTCIETESGIEIFHTQGALEKNSWGNYVQPRDKSSDPLAAMNGHIDNILGMVDRRLTEGEPVDELAKSMEVLEEIRTKYRQQSPHKNRRWFNRKSEK